MSDDTVENQPCATPVRSKSGHSISEEMVVDPIVVQEQPFSEIVTSSDASVDDTGNGSLRVVLTLYYL